MNARRRRPSPFSRPSCSAEPAPWGVDRPDLAWQRCTDPSEPKGRRTGPTLVKWPRPSRPWGIPMSDLTRLTAVDAARRIESGSLTVEALARAYLDHIADRELAVGAWQHL